MKLRNIKIKERDIPLRLLSQITINQSINKFVTTGRIVLNDFILKEFYEFFANDSIELIIEDELLNKTYNIKFIIYKVGGTKVNNGEYDTLEMFFCSPWAIDFYTKPISLTYTEKSISNIVNDLFYRCNVKINNLEETLDIIDFTSPLWSSSCIIKHLMRFAQNQESKAGFLCFPDFESQKINFVSTDFLISEKLGLDKIGLYYDKLDGDLPAAIKTLNIEKEFDVIENIDKGLGNLKAKSFNYNYLVDDNTNDNISETNIKLKQYKRNKLSKYIPLSKDFEEDEYQTQFLTHFNNNSLNEAFIKNKYNKVLNSMIKINMLVAPSLERKIGMITTLNFPSNQNNKYNNNEKLTGKYLITDIKYIFDEERFTQTLSLSSEGYKTSKIENLIES